MISSLQLSFKSRMSLLMIGVVVTLGVCIRFFLEHRLVDAMETELDERGIAIAKHLASESVDSMLYQDNVALQHLLSRAVSANGDLEYAYVLDASRRVAAHTLELDGEFPRELRRLNRLTANRASQVARISAFGLQYRDVAVPIYGGELGVLHLGFHDRSLVERLSVLRRDIILLLAAVAAAGAALSYILVRRGLRPMDAIVDTLESFRPGRHRDEIPVVRSDEVGEVARRVNLVTERLHQTQRQLERANRLAFLGRLASVIVHEIGNPLASVTTRLSLMERSDDHELIRESAPILRKQIGRIQRIAEGLSRVSRGAAAGVQQLGDVNFAIEEVLEMMRFDPRGKTARISLDLGTVGRVRCSHDHVVQAISNLLLNAVQAGENRAVHVASREDDGRACVDVTDDGPGIADPYAERIFEPFFTTRNDGTGLGLAISRHLVRQQGGDLVLVPSDRGAHFRLSIPLDRMGANA